MFSPVVVQKLGCYRVVATVKLELRIVIQSLNLIWANVVLLLQPLQILRLVLLELLDEALIAEELDDAFSLRLQRLQLAHHLQGIAPAF